jgi:hypothetical protein
MVKTLFDMPLHVATLKEFKKCRGGEGARGASGRKKKSKRKIKIKDEILTDSQRESSDTEQGVRSQSIQKISQCFFIIALFCIPVTVHSSRSSQF